MSLLKNSAKEKIDLFFAKNSFSQDDLRKIRNLAMQYRIRLGKYRQLFCKHCLSQLKGQTRISEGYKTVVCSACGKNNRFKL